MSNRERHDMPRRKVCFATCGSTHDGHMDELRPVHIVHAPSGMDYGVYWYCEAAIRQDIADGFTVMEVEAPLEHELSTDCWCEPTLEYTDPETGDKVWVHRERQ